MAEERHGDVLKMDRKVADALDVARVVEALGLKPLEGVQEARTGDADQVHGGFPKGDLHLHAREYSGSFSGSEQSDVEDNTDGKGHEPQAVLTLASARLLRAHESSDSGSEDEKEGAAKRQRH